MTTSARLKERLEILLITYNRFEYLSATLQELERSPFRECHITILDNCSYDATSERVSRFRELFPKFTYIRNRVNIGGNPNYLKAIELSSSEYTWILCDDDVFDFSDCEDVTKVLENDNFDLIEVGATEKGNWPRGIATTVNKMLEQNLDYHFRMSFFPAYIFKTSLFDSNCFCWGYKNIDRLYPQFEFLNKSMRENFSIYLSKNKIVIRNDVNEHSFSPLFWYVSWVECCKTIEDAALRTRTIEHATNDRGFFKSLCFWSILDRRISTDSEFGFRVVKILRVMSWQQRLKYLLVFPLVLLPLPFAFWVWVRSTIYNLMNVPSEDIPPLNVVNRG